MKIEKGVEPIEPSNPIHHNRDPHPDAQQQSEQDPQEKREPIDFEARLKQARDDLEERGEKGWVA